MGCFIALISIKAHNSKHPSHIRCHAHAGNGGCFPMHHDSDEAVDARRMSAILYRNADWHPHNGGELVLRPLGSPPVTIPPRAGTLVLFSSCRMLHR